MGVEVVAEAVADEVEAENAEGYGHGGEEDEVRGLEEVGTGVVEHGSPGGGGRLDAEAEKAEGGFGEHGSCHADGGLDEQGLHNVGEDVAEEQAGVVGAERAGGLDELALFHGHDLGADEAGVVDPAGKREGENEVDEAGPEECDEGYGEEDARKGEEGVGEIDVDERVGEPTVEAGEHAEDEADGEREAYDGNRNRERDSGAVNGAGEDVAT